MHGATYRDRRFRKTELILDAAENSIESWLETRFHLLAIQDVKSYTCCVMDARQL